jgi:flagellar basal body-associated protein FliL
MKSLKIALLTLVVACIVVVLVSSSTVAAFSSSDATVETHFSSDALRIGQLLDARIVFYSNTQQVKIQRIGFQFDFNDINYFYGPDLSDNPVTVAANDSYTTDPILFYLPANATQGLHTYYVGVEGLDAAGNSFSWDSSNQSITVISSGGTTTTPTPTVTATPSGGGGTAATQNWTLYILVIAVVAIGIAVAFIFMEVRKKPKKSSPVAESPTSPAESPKPEADKPAPATDQPLKDIEE